MLTDGLVQAGHEVVLWASGDSQTLAELRSFFPRSLRAMEHVDDETPYAWIHAVKAITDSAEFDIMNRRYSDIADSHPDSSGPEIAGREARVSCGERTAFPQLSLRRRRRD